MVAQTDIRISKESDVTIHDQLVAEITFFIATRKWKPGEALPSVRDMARRLEINRNTVSQVYQELETHNLVLRRRGSRMLVRSPGEVTSSPHLKDIDDVINQTLQAAQEAGYSIQQLRRRLRERLMAERPDHLLAVSDDSGIRHLLREELRESLGFPVETCSPDDLTSAHELMMGTLVVGPGGAISKIAGVVPKDRPAIPITFSSGSEQLERVRQLREPSTIAVVSISEFVLQTARGVLAPVVGQQHTLQEYFLPQQPAGNLEAADLVICDVIAARRVEARNVIQYRLVSPECLKILASAMKEGVNG